MKTEVKKLDRLKRVLRIEVEEENVARDKNEIYKKLSRDLKVPGFRTGTAPLEIVEKHYKKFLEEEFLKHAIPDYYSRALKENGLTPVGLPKIYDVVFSNKGLSFSAEFEVKPQLEVKDEDYKNIKIKNRKIKVEEIEVEKLITQLKENVKKIVKKDYTDDDLAKWAGYPSKDSLREAIRAEIFVNKIRAQRNEIENTIAEELIKRVKVEIPHSLLKEQEEHLLRQEMVNLQRQGVEEKDIKKYEDDIRKKISKIAEKQIKLYYIFEAIARKESLEVNERNLSEAVMGFVLSRANYTKE